MIHSVDIHVNTFFRKNVLMTPTLPIADRWPMGGGLTFEQTAAHRVYENKELRRRILSGKVASHFGAGAGGSVGEASARVLVAASCSAAESQSAWRAGSQPFRSWSRGFRG